MTEIHPPTVSGHVLRDGAGRFWIDVPRRSACQSCDKTSSCSMSVLGGLVGSATIRLPIQGMDIQVGDRVRLACPSDGLLKAALLAYGLPALGMVVGAVLMSLMNFNDGPQALGAGLGLFLGVMATRWLVARGHLPALTYFEE